MRQSGIRGMTLIHHLIITIGQGHFDPGRRDETALFDKVYN